jgi:hypothetical protein
VLQASVKGSLTCQTMQATHLYSGAGAVRQHAGCDSTPSGCDSTPQMMRLAGAKGPAHAPLDGQKNADVRPRPRPNSARGNVRGAAASAVFKRVSAVLKWALL